MSRCRYNARHAYGYSMLEMVLSTVVLSTVMVSVTSAVVFASSANPDEDSPEVTLATDSNALSRIAEDISMARYVLEQSTNRITFVVADRTGDDIPDRIQPFSLLAFRIIFPFRLAAARHD